MNKKQVFFSKISFEEVACGISVVGLWTGPVDKKIKLGMDNFCEGISNSGSTTTETTFLQLLVHE